MQTQTLLVAVGGALGSVARYWLDGAVYRLLPATFPYGTFIVNVTGCLAFGLLIGVAGDRLTLGSPARALLLVGLLGGFTTFSSFAFETFTLARQAAWTLLVMNVGGQVLLGLLALWTGVVVGRTIGGAA